MPVLLFGLANTLDTFVGGLFHLFHVEIHLARSDLIVLVKTFAGWLQ